MLFFKITGLLKAIVYGNRFRIHCYFFIVIKVTKVVIFPELLGDENIVFHTFYPLICFKKSSDLRCQSSSTPLHVPVSSLPSKLCPPFYGNICSKSQECSTPFPWVQLHLKPLKNPFSFIFVSSTIKTIKKYGLQISELYFYLEKQIPPSTSLSYPLLMGRNIHFNY